MSVTGLFSIGASAMKASYAALQTTGNNIANANTPGYSRQQVNLASAGSQFTGSGFFGKGVDVTTVTRAHDAFLAGEAALTQSQAQTDSTRLAQLQQLEQVFGTGQSGLGYSSGQLIAAFGAVASNPQDSSARQVALSQAQQTAAAFSAAGKQIDVLQAGVVQDMKTSIATVNGLAQTVARLNQQIASATASGQPPNDLLDQRDSAVSEIGKYVQVTAVNAGDGTQSLFIGGGQCLVLGADATQLTAVADTYDASQVHVGISGAGGARLVPDSMITGGSMAGLLRFQNEDLPDARNTIGQMAAALSGALNARQHLGLDLTTVSGRPGGDLFAVGAPRVLPASSNSGNAGLGLQVTDPAKLQASNYQLRFDGSSYTLTRIGSQDPPQAFTPAALAAGVTVDGMTVTLASGAAAAGDSFQLQPVAAAAASMQSVLSDPRGIAAASPVTATLGTTNTGTLAIQSLAVMSPIAAPSHAVVKFDAPAGGPTSYQISVDGGSTFAPAQPLVAGQPIGLTDGAGVLLWQLSVTGTPATGDVIQVDPTSFPASNNGNALSLAALGNAKLVNGNNVTDAWANALADVGVRVQSATSASQLSSAAASDAATRNSSTAGVNLDEEAARLIQYQQSYQAAAKMLQVAQTVFDALLKATAP